MDKPSIQETYAPDSTCFGCGPANEKGLNIRSFIDGDTLVAEWQPEPHHEAFPGALNGGIICTLLDCHSNWTASWQLMQRKGLDRPPPTVTAEFSVKMLRPTPTGAPVRLVARVAAMGDRSATTEGDLIAGGEICATCRGTFVIVRPGHPAYDRWGT